MKRLGFIWSYVMLLAMFGPAAADASARSNPATAADHITKVLYIGDSMTGWLSDRLNAYGAENGFEVATVLWDGSTIRKWGNSPKLASIISKHNPDVVFISLGLNELLEPRPEKRLGKAMDNILRAVGNRRMVWVGPPSWPGKGDGKKLTEWIKTRVGEKNFFNSTGLTLQRQSKTNPHPTREASVVWTDAIVQWLKTRSDLKFASLKKPTGNKMLRGKAFTYRRMRQQL